MRFSPTLSDPQRDWLQAHGYIVLSLIARGKSSGVWLVEKNGKKFAAKCEHAKSYRVQMLEREVLQLKMVNALGVGPKLFDSSAVARIILMQFIEGKTLHAFIAHCTDKKIMTRVIDALLLQAKKLDAAGIDHGQLGGKLANILVDTKDQPHLIDFEKASYVRKVHNVSHLQRALFGGKSLPSRKLHALVGVEIETRGWQSPLQRITKPSP